MKRVSYILMSLFIVLVLTHSVTASQGVAQNSNASSSIDVYHNDNSSSTRIIDMNFDFTKMSLNDIKQYFGVTSGGTMQKSSDGALIVRPTSYRGSAYIYSLFTIHGKYAYRGLTIKVRFKLSSGWTKAIDAFPQIVYHQDIINHYTLPDYRGIMYPLFHVYGGYGDGYKDFLIWGYNGDSWTTVDSTSWHPSNGGSYCAEIQYYPDKVVASYYDFSCSNLLSQLTYYVPNDYKGKYLDYYYNNGPKKFPDDNFIFFMGVHDDYTENGIYIYDISIHIIEGGKFINYRPRKVFVFPKPAFDLWSDMNKFQMSYIYEGNLSVSGSYSGSNIPIRVASHNGYIVKGVFMPYSASLSTNPSLDNSTYLIVVKGVLFGDYRCLYNSINSDTGGNHVGVFVNGKMIFWEPVYCQNSEFLNDESLSAGDYIVNLGNSEHVEKYGQPFRVMLLYNGPIQSLKVNVVYASSDDNINDNFAIIRSVDVYRVSAQKVYDSGSNLSKALNNGDFTAVDENGHQSTKTTYISETNETIIGGGSGFGHGAKIILNKRFQTINGLYAVKFRYYFFDSWDAEDGSNPLGDSAVLYDGDNYLWGMQFASKDFYDSGSEAVFPLNKLKEWGFITRLSNNYFDNNWPDYYTNISIVLPESNITKLIWSNTLGHDGSDESMGLGRVQVYKITNVKVIDISSGIYIPMPVEETSNPHPVQYEWNTKTLLNKDYGKVVLYYKNDSTIASYNFNPVLVNYNITLKEYDLKLKKYYNYSNQVISFISFKIPESYTIKLSSHDGYASDVISSQYDNEHYEFTVKNSKFKPIVMTIINPDNKIVGALMFIPANKTENIPIILYQYNTETPEDLPLDKKDYLNVTFIPHYDDCSAIMNYTAKEVSTDSLNIIHQNGMQFYLQYQITASNGEVLMNKYNESTGVLSLSLKFNKQNSFNIMRSIILKKNGLTLYSLSNLVDSNPEWMISVYTSSEKPLEITNYAVNNLTEYKFVAPDGTVKYLYSLTLSFDYHKVLDFPLSFSVSINNDAVTDAHIMSGDLIGNITQKLLDTSTISPPFTTNAVSLCGEGHEKLVIYFNYNRALTSSDKLKIDFSNTNTNKEFTVNVNITKIKTINFFENNHIQVKNNDVTISYPGFQGYSMLFKVNGKLNNPVCSAIDNSVSITLNNNGGVEESYMKLNAGIIGGSLPSPNTVSLCNLLLDNDNDYIVVKDTSNSYNTYVFSTMNDFLNYIVKNNIQTVNFSLMAPMGYEQGYITIPRASTANADVEINNNDSNNNDSGMLILSATLNVIDTQGLKNALNTLNSITGFETKPIILYLTRVNDSNSNPSNITVLVQQVSNVKELINVDNGEEISVSPGTELTIKKDENQKTLYIIPNDPSKPVLIHFNFGGKGKVKITLKGPELTVDNKISVHGGNYGYISEDNAEVEIKPVVIDNYSYKITRANHIILSNDGSGDVYEITMELNMNVSYYYTTNKQIYIEYDGTGEMYIGDIEPMNITPGTINYRIPIIIAERSDILSSIKNIEVDIYDCDNWDIVQKLIIPFNFSSITFNNTIIKPSVQLITSSFNPNNPTQVNYTIGRISDLFPGKTIVYYTDLIQETINAIKYNTTVSDNEDDEEEAHGAVSGNDNSGYTADDLPVYFIINNTKQVVTGGFLDLVDFLLKEANTNDQIVAVFNYWDNTVKAKIINIDYNKLLDVKTKLTSPNYFIMYNKPEINLDIDTLSIGAGSDSEIIWDSEIFNTSVTNMQNLVISNTPKFGIGMIKIYSGVMSTINTGGTTKYHYSMHIQNTTKKSSFTFKITTLPFIVSTSKVSVSLIGKVFTNPEYLESYFVYSSYGGGLPLTLASVRRKITTGISLNHETTPYPGDITDITHNDIRGTVAIDLTKAYNITYDDAVNDLYDKLTSIPHLSALTIDTNKHLIGIIDYTINTTLPQFINGTTIKLTKEYVESLPSYYKDRKLNITAHELNFTMKEIPANTYLVIYVNITNTSDSNINKIIGNLSIKVNGVKQQNINHMTVSYIMYWDTKHYLVLYLPLQETTVDTRISINAGSLDNRVLNVYVAQLPGFDSMTTKEQQELFKIMRGSLMYYLPNVKILYSDYIACFSSKSG